MALNRWVGMGRLTAQPEQKQTTTGKAVVSFTVAIDRNSKGQNGEKQTDFLNCVAWEKTAEMICRYFGKGSMICVEGSVQTRSWTAQDGSKRYTTEIVVERVHFTGEKSSAPTEQNLGNPYAAPTAPQFEEVRDDDDLPF